MEKQQQQQQQQPSVNEGEVRVLKFTALVYGVIGLPCLICGIVTMVYAADDLKWPVSSGFGIVVGALALAMCTMGLMAFMRYNYENPAANRCPVFGFYGFMTSNLSLSGIHLGWSISGLIKCNDGEFSFCLTGDKDRFLVVTGFSIGCAAVLILLNMWSMGYILSARRLQRLTATRGCCNCFSRC